MNFVGDFTLNLLYFPLNFKNEHFAYHLPTEPFFEEKMCGISTHFFTNFQFSKTFYKNYDSDQFGHQIVFGDIFFTKLLKLKAQTFLKELDLCFNLMNVKISLFSQEITQMVPIFVILSNIFVQIINNRNNITYYSSYFIKINKKYLIIS